MHYSCHVLSIFVYAPLNFLRKLRGRHAIKDLNNIANSILLTFSEAKQGQTDKCSTCEILLGKRNCMCRNIMLKNWHGCYL